MSLESVLEEFGARAPVPTVKVGAFTRIRASDDPAGKKSIWVKMDVSGNAVYGDWRTGESHVFTGNADVKTDSAERAKRAAEAKAATEAEQAEIAAKAKAIWASLPKANENHPYLVRKGLGCFSAYFKQKGAMLVLPVRDILTGELVNLQYIQPAKPKVTDPETGEVSLGRDKTFLKGGRLSGCGVWLGKPKAAQSVIFCEGFATGASIHWATGAVVCCVLTSSNYLAAATKVRKQLPDARFVFAADHDKVNPRTGKRAGIAKANESISFAGGKLALPSNEGEDFNDVHALQGLNAVKSYFEGI